MTKKQRNHLSSNLYTMNQVIRLALEAQAKGEKMWNDQTPEQCLASIADGLWKLSQELKSA